MIMGRRTEVRRATVALGGPADDGLLSAELFFQIGLQLFNLIALRSDELLGFLTEDALNDWNFAVLGLFFEQNCKMICVILQKCLLAREPGLDIRKAQKLFDGPCYCRGHCTSTEGRQ